MRARTSDLKMIDPYRIDRTISATRRHARDLFHQFNRCIVTLAEDGVSSVQMGRRHFSDEELRAVGTRPGVGHGQAPGALEGHAGVELVFKLIAGPADALSQRIAALDHEAGNHPMKNGSIIERASGLL